MQRILVWDLPTRIGHWLLVTAFILAWLTGDSEERRLLHVAAGYSMAAVLIFRIFWGLAGTRYARFVSFLFSPREVFEYLGGLLKGKVTHWVGHNPAGSYAIYLLILLGLATTASGWAAYQEVGGEWMEEAHDLLADIMLAVVVLHVLGVLVSSVAHREKLVLSMLNGYKQGASEQGIESAKALWLVLLLALVCTAVWLAYAT